MRESQKKPDGSPVTLADQKVSEFLVSALRPLGYPVVSEEDLPSVPPTEGTYFLVDPLDGTKYFARGEDEFAICVGLLEQGQPSLGVIADPTQGDLYWAEQGQGAFRNQDPIRHEGVTGDLRVFSSGFHKRPEKQFIVEALGIGEIMEKGSALKFCDMAMGKADLYMRFGPTSEWDTAAAQVILQEADCWLFEGRTLDVMTYGKEAYLNRGLLAGHHSQQEKVIGFLKEHGPLKRKK